VKKMKNVRSARGGGLTHTVDHAKQTTIDKGILKLGGSGVASV